MKNRIILSPIVIGISVNLFRLNWLHFYMFLFLYNILNDPVVNVKYPHTKIKIKGLIRWWRIRIHLSYVLEFKQKPFMLNEIFYAFKAFIKMDKKNPTISIKQSMMQKKNICVLLTHSIYVLSMYPWNILYSTLYQYKTTN